MLCSRCSEPVAPVVAIDIDGTMAPYHPHFIEFASSWLGYEPRGREEYTGHPRFREWMCDVYNIDLSTFRAIKLAYRQGGMKRTMGVYPGASPLVRSLRDAGAEVWLTTTRPHERYDRIDPDTVEWTRRNRIEFDGLLFGHDKLSTLVDRIDPRRVVAVLDDLPWVLERAEELGLGVPVLRRTRWNRAAEWEGLEYNRLDEATDGILYMMMRRRDGRDERSGAGSEQDGGGEHRSGDPGRVESLGLDRGE